LFKIFLEERYQLENSLLLDDSVAFRFLIKSY